ncbi:hypothetical protein B0H10DRAFT_2296551 [Mycena sp. CBHHK59/15]|nr:hypothetical protein B0H10DRAFT_2296551 [Mycena sp. CBHHK59/15]
MSDGEDASTFTQRRIRHITSIQVRNLTAFPVRDAFASALSQPSEQPQFNAPGHFSDDLDVTLSRKRSRRISTNSVATYKSFKSDESAGDEGGHAVAESRGRRRTGSRMSFHGGGSVGSTSSPAARLALRPRTSSIASSMNSSVQASTAFPGSMMSASTVPFSTALPDHSQTGLEKVIKARLFETFIAVSVESSSPHRHLLPAPNLPGNITPSRKGVKLSPLSPSEKTSFSARRDLPSSPAKHTPKSASMSALSRPNGKLAASPSSRKFPATPIPPVQPRPRSPSPSSPASPDYLSLIHRPSTNPSFAIDTRSGYDFGPWTDPSGHKLKVELWGKVGDGRGSHGLVQGKGKEKEMSPANGEDEIEWRVLEEWKVDLGDLLNSAMYPTFILPSQLELPSNTLVVTLYPPGRTFYLPSSFDSERRSPTPSAGYASDPESGGTTLKKKVGDFEKVSPESLAADVGALVRRRHRRGPGGTPLDRDQSKTAGWQDLFKLVTLQSCIQDNQVSLIDLVREIDKVLEGDLTSALKREVSERESLVQGLRKNCAAVYDQSEILKEQIELRRQQLQERRELLALAQEQRDDDLFSAEEREEQLSEARTELLSLRSRFAPTRTTLISTLSTIFPIELLSPPDLLYIILDVPLPIPLSASDPAPPLTLLAHKEVTEDAVATALGYVAQVVQLLAVYLGKGLVYHITCIGSRSMIRDGISAMVGPRMFPLFSKGVDTYRFEYGVFLLNKDIELLMADRDLRALDMRHTLPNLKNLLLTLTDGEGAQLGVPRPFNSPELSIKGLESPRAESPVENGSTTPKAISSELPAEGNSPLASGSTTPTTEIGKKSRSFIGLSPIAGFLRARYPSAIRASSVKPVSEASEEPVHPHENGESELVVVEEGDMVVSWEDDEDRRTIRGDPDAVVEDAKASNGGERASEKLGDVPAHAPTPPPPITPIK